MKLIYLSIVLFCFACCDNSFKKNKAEIEKRHKISVLSSSQRGDTLELVSSDKLVWEPFGHLSVNVFKKQHPNFFRIENNQNIIRLIGTGSKIVISINKPVKNAEGLAEHHNSQVPLYSLREVEISTPQIMLQYGIRVGMSKDDFFKLIDYSPFMARKVSIVQFFDPPGDTIEQTYVFKNGKLENIKMKSPSL